ncbi:MAG: hypothetical protein ACE5IC_04935 [Candidatus Brocadiales bacterium]
MYSYVLASLIIVISVALPNPVLSWDDSLGGSTSRYFKILEMDASCTDRCHVASPLYKNEFEGEIFRHTTHSPLQQLGCDDCHDKSDVKDEKHGKLLINQEDCLTCHHVDYKEESCALCHDDIDSNPMDYKDEPFFHGFGVDSGIDCKMCHLPDPKSTMRDGINCDNCHHATPNITCAKCHEKDLDKNFVGNPLQMARLGWTDQFLHSQHPEDKHNCLECHLPDPYSVKGVKEYDFSCTGCHHKDTEESCDKCHRDFADFFRGELEYKGIVPVPDKMSRVLKCEDCHKLKGDSFLDVRGMCAGCHNPQYAELLDAQQKVIEAGFGEIINRFVQMEDGHVVHRLEHYQDLYKKVFSGVELLQLYGIHNFSYAARILSFLEDIMKSLEYGSE